MLGDVNKLFVFKNLLTNLGYVLPLHLKQTLPPIIWIFTIGEGDGQNPGYILKSFLLNIFMPFGLIFDTFWQFLTVNNSSYFLGECDSENVSFHGDLEAGCRPDNTTTTLCNNRGDCMCGKCECYPRPNPNEVNSYEISFYFLAQTRHYNMFHPLRDLLMSWTFDFCLLLEPFGKGRENFNLNLELKLNLGLIWIKLKGFCSIFWKNCLGKLTMICKQC